MGAFASRPSEGPRRVLWDTCHNLSPGVQDPSTGGIVAPQVDVTDVPERGVWEAGVCSRWRDVAIFLS